MSDEKISAMPAAAALTGAELVPLVQGGANVKGTTQSIANLAPPPPAVTITKGATATSGFAVGDILISAAGPVVGSVPDVAVNQVLASGGIGAPATWTGAPIVTSIQFGSGTALNDYEEGTWTPTDASGAGLSFTIFRASFTKIGRQVNLDFNLKYPVTANGNIAAIGGLPFAAPTNLNALSPVTATGAIDFTLTNLGAINFLSAAAVFKTNVNLSGNFIEASAISYPNI